MKKTLLFFAFIALTVIACQDTSEEISPNQEVVEIDMSDFFVYTDSDDASKSTNKGEKDKCHSMKVLNRQLKENSGLYKKMYNIEKHTRKAIAAKEENLPILEAEMVVEQILPQSQPYIQVL